MTENAIAKEIVVAAYGIHTTLGPGWLESVYDTVWAYELGRRGLRTVRQQALPVVYENVRIDAGFRADLIVDSAAVSIAIPTLASRPRNRAKPFSVTRKVTFSSP